MNGADPSQMVLDTMPVWELLPFDLPEIFVLSLPVWGVDNTNAKFIWLISLTLLMGIIWRREHENHRLFSPWPCYSGSQQGGQPWQWFGFFPVDFLACWPVHELWDCHIVTHWAVVRDSHLQGVTLGQHSVWHERCGSPSPGCHISPHALFPLHPHQKGEILALRDIFRQTSGLSITTCITWERSICPIFYFYSWNSFWTDSFKTANLLLYTGFQPRRKQNTWVAFWSVPS